MKIALDRVAIPPRKLAIFAHQKGAWSHQIKGAWSKWVSRQLIANFDLKRVWRIVFKMWSSFLLVAVVCCSLLQCAVGDVDSSSLLWPIPVEVTTVDSTVKYLDSEKFHFSTDLDSAILNNGFQRYMGILFKSPTPFVPGGAPEKATEEMRMLTVKVTNPANDTLDEDTDESCKRRNFKAPFC